MGLTEETVTTELQKLLQSVDLATTSEKKVVELLRKQLGDGVDEHKTAIQVLPRQKRPCVSDDRLLSHQCHACSKA